MDARDILDHPVIGQRYFFPRREAPPAPWRVEVEGATLVGHRSRASIEPSHATLLHFHGNGEVVADWVDGFTPALNARGLDVALAEYRGYGGSSGSPMLATMLDDALATFDALGEDPARVVVYGRSVGSIFGLHVAAHRKVSGLVIESGIADVLERLDLRLDASELGVSRAELEAAARELLDQQKKLAAAACPLLVLHTRGDHMVDPSHAERFAEWGGERAELVLFDRGDHNSIHAYNGDAIVELVARFSRR
ncbi:MAG: alpha/beta hydrolase [Sandaracinaceae bacterium]